MQEKDHEKDGYNRSEDKQLIWIKIWIPLIEVAGIHKTGSFKECVNYIVDCSSNRLIMHFYGFLGNSDSPLGSSQM